MSHKMLRPFIVKVSEDTVRIRLLPAAMVVIITQDTLIGVYLLSNTYESLITNNNESLTNIHI